MLESFVLWTIRREGEVRAMASQVVTDAALPFKQKRQRKFDKTLRFTCDMHKEQHNFLRLFAADNDVSASTVFRCLLYLLQQRRDLATLVIDLIYAHENPLQGKAKKSMRYTVDLYPEQHNFLRLFSAHNEVRASTVVRTLLYLLETRIDLATLVIEEIFPAEEETAENTESDEDATEEYVEVDATDQEGDIEYVGADE